MLCDELKPKAYEEYRMGPTDVQIQKFAIICGEHVCSNTKADMQDDSKQVEVNNRKRRARFLSCLFCDGQKKDKDLCTILFPLPKGRHAVSNQLLRLSMIEPGRVG